MDGNRIAGQTPNLADYIQAGGYQTVELNSSFVDEGGEALAEAINPLASDESTRRLTTETLANVQTGEDSSSAVGNTDGNAETATPLTAEQQAEESRIAQMQADLERREAAFVQEQEAARRQQAQAAFEAEQRRFLAHYNGIDDPAEKRAAFAEYRAYVAERNAKAASESLQNVTQQTAQQREQIAKNQVIYATMRQEQIPTEFKMFLDKAANADELTQMVGQVKKFMANNKVVTTQAARQERVQSGVDVAGGNNAGFVPPAEPKKRSGDLMGLINSRQHQLINAMVEPA